MEKLNGKEIERLSLPVAAIKKSEVEAYIENFSIWKHKVGVLALQILSDKKSTDYNGSIDDVLGKVLIRPPLLGDLSVPVFLNKQIAKDNSMKYLICQKDTCIFLSPLMANITLVFILKSQAR